MRKIPYKTNQNHPEIKSYREAVEKGRESHHILPKNGSWIVKRAGSVRATKTFSTKEAAQKTGERIAKNQGTSLFVHGRDGRIRERKDY
jgi:hypothetical protein